MPGVSEDELTEVGIKDLKETPTDLRLTLQQGYARLQHREPEVTTVGAQEPDRRFHTFAIVFTVALSAVLLALFKKGIVEAGVVGAIAGVLVFLVRPIWYPRGYGQYRVKLFSLKVAMAAILSVGIWQAFLAGVLAEILKERFPKLDNVHTYGQVLIFIFLLAVIRIVNRDTTAMGMHRGMSAEFTLTEALRNKLVDINGSLAEDLKSLDKKYLFTEKQFVPLEAEVEIVRKGRRIRKVMNLLEAIRASKSRLFLVLGDPGSGKSVAMRKLCRDLGKEVKKTGKLPVYVNLKEWAVNKEWSEEDPPTVVELYDFVKSNLMARDIVVSRFLAEYFDVLYETGHLFFVLDSFDEIPAVLDEREDSELIEKLSGVIHKFLKGARSPESQGVLTSRFFRRPTDDFKSETTLEIRPLSEAKVIKLLKLSGAFTTESVKRLFIERPELVSLAKNPFTSNLLVAYTDANNKALPANQAAMYESYIKRALEGSEDRMLKKGLTAGAVHECAIAIATEMFEKYGLDAPLDELSERIPDFAVRDVVGVMIFARLGRLGTGDENQFSFAHRRIAEYFAVQKLIRGDRKVDLDAIPRDSQWRDALVLYVEVASDEQAKAVAAFCWERIEAAEETRSREIAHVLRFLRDAFSSRVEAIAPFRDELGDFVVGRISSESNFLSVKLALETVGLLGAKAIDAAILKAFKFGDTWINDTAVRSCRNLKSISDELEKSLSDVIRHMPFDILLPRYSRLRFSLALSEAFSEVLRFLRFRFAHLCVLGLVGLFLAVVALPLFLLCFLITIVWLIGRLALTSKIEVSLHFFMRSFLVLALLLSMLFSGVYLVTETSLESKVLDEFFLTVEVSLRWLLLGSVILLILVPPYYEAYFHSGWVLSSRTWVLQRLKEYLPALVMLALFLALPTRLKALLDAFLDSSWVTALGFVFWGGIGLLVMWRLASDVVFSLRRYQSTDLSQLKHREHIYAALSGRTPPLYRRLLFGFLEKNIRAVDGEWPSEDILSVSAGNTRLAILEERWRGLDR